MTYSVKFGQGTVSQTATAFHARGPGGGGGLFGGGGQGGAGSAGGSGRPGSGQGGGFRSLFSPLPQSPPADPFAVGANPQTCTAENVGKARQLSAELKAYQAQIEAARTAAGYPATMPAPAKRCWTFYTCPRCSGWTRKEAISCGHWLPAGLMI